MHTSCDGFDALAEAMVPTRAGPHSNIPESFMKWDKTDAFRQIPTRVADLPLGCMFVPSLGHGFTPVLCRGSGSSPGLFHRAGWALIQLNWRIVCGHTVRWVDDSTLALS